MEHCLISATATQSSCVADSIFSSHGVDSASTLLGSPAQIMDIGDLSAHYDVNTALPLNDKFFSVLEYWTHLKY